MCFLLKNKVYPRERDPKDLKYRGRLRVQLKDEDGVAIKQEFPTREFAGIFHFDVSYGNNNVGVLGYENKCCSCTFVHREIAADVLG